MFNIRNHRCQDRYMYIMHIFLKKIDILMTILTVWMTRSSIHTTSASSTCISVTLYKILKNYCSLYIIYNVYQWCWLIIIYTCIFNFTFGPHLGPLVAQQSSVLHMVHAIQSHPYFFCSTILQEGHLMASPLRSNSYIYYRNHLSCSLCTVLPVQA